MRFNLKYYLLALLISSTIARAQNPIPNQKINLTSSSSYKEMKKQYIIEQTIENIAENNEDENIDYTISEFRHIILKEQELI